MTATCSFQRRRRRRILVHLLFILLDVLQMMVLLLLGVTQAACVEYLVTEVPQELVCHFAPDDFLTTSHRYLKELKKF